jgi:hypothetical protein
MASMRRELASGGEMRRGIEAVSDLELCGFLREIVGEALVDRLLHEEPLSARHSAICP